LTPTKICEYCGLSRELLLLLVQRHLRLLQLHGVGGYGLLVAVALLDTGR
jgi:hypothetical protein